MPKYEAVTWAIHWLEGPLFLLNVEAKHVVLIMLPMTRLFP